MNWWEFLKQKLKAHWRLLIYGTSITSDQIVIDKDEYKDLIRDHVELVKFMDASSDLLNGQKKWKKS